MNTLLHELLHIIFGKFKQDKPTEYKNLISLLLEEFKNRNSKGYNDYMELYKNWNEDFRNEEVVIKFLTKSKISVKLKNSSYFNNFMELLNSISPKSENINLRDALNNTVYSIFGNDYEANKFIKSDLKKDLLIESYIYKILKNSEEC